MASTSGTNVTSGPEKLYFNCPKCQKRWSWKPPMAGKKVKCQCGAVFAAPAKPPAPLPSAPVRVSVTPPTPAPVERPASGSPSQIAPMTKGVTPPKRDDSLYGLAPGEEKPKTAPKPQPVVAEVVGPAPGKKSVGKIMGHPKRPIASRGEEDDGSKKKKMLAIGFVIVCVLFAAYMVASQFGYLDKLFKK